LKSIKFVNSTLIKQLEIFHKKDVSQLQTFINSVNEQFQHNPKLFELFKLYKIIFEIKLNLSDQLYKLLQILPVTYKSKDLLEIEKDIKIVEILKSDTLKIIDNLKLYGLSNKVVLTNSKIAEALAYQLVAPCVGLDSKQLDTLIKTAKLELKQLKHDIKELKTLVQLLKQKAEQGLKSLKQETFEKLKEFLKNAVDKTLRLIYKTYKKLAILIAKVSSTINKYISLTLSKTVKLLAGDDPKKQFIITSIFSLLGLYATKTETFKKLLSGSFLGPLVTVFTIVQVINKIASMEISTINTLSSIARQADITLELLDSIDSEMNDVLVG